MSKFALLLCLLAMTLGMAMAADTGVTTMDTTTGEVTTTTSPEVPANEPVPVVSTTDGETSMPPATMPTTTMEEPVVAMPTTATTTDDVPVAMPTTVGDVSMQNMMAETTNDSAAGVVDADGSTSVTTTTHISGTGIITTTTTVDGSAILTAAAHAAAAAAAAAAAGVDGDATAIAMDYRFDSNKDGWINLGTVSDGVANADAPLIVLMALVGGGLSLCMAFVFRARVMSVKVDAEKFPETTKIATLIQEGASAFLKAEYTALTIFVIVIGTLLIVFISWQSGVNYFVGAFLSASAGWIGMKIAVVANVRTTLSCEGPHGLNNGLQVAFRSGAVMSMCVTGLGLVGVSVMYLIFDGEDDDVEEVFKHLAGFAFGASSIALFARVGGGIYTKAADVGADLVGKCEEELAEDSPENPATIADNVGDNVGDVAGMGADLFESFVGSIIAASTLGVTYGNAGIALPFWVAGCGALCSILGCLIVKSSPRDGDDKRSSDDVLKSLLGSINVGIYGASFLVIITSAISVCVTFGPENDFAWKLFGCIMFGLVAGNLIGYTTEYATSYTEEPTKSIAKKSDTGPATVIIQGLGVGMLSTVPPVFFIVATILGAYYLADDGTEDGGIYGIAIAGVGMLSTLGVTLATDAYGPVADNAGGIAEMAPDAEVSRDVREKTDALDALGNTTAATGKGFAIGSAVLTALALMHAFAKSANLSRTDVSVLDPVFLPGVLIGAGLPFVFAALTMLSVGKAAEAIMWECREQLNNRFHKGSALDPNRCVAISTTSSLIEMVIPGALAIFAPLIVGTILGSKGLLGVLVGSISSGFLLAVTMANAGGAWDNAKKWVEKGGLGPGKGKGSAQHKAVVVGDTIGDPFKDTSGPALNILIKLMSVVALVIGEELSKDPWEHYYVGIGIIGGLVIAYFIFNKFIVKFAVQHNQAEIEADSIKRKSGDAVAAVQEDVKATATDAAVTSV